MEDTATAEICRAQLWHWVNHPEARLSGGARITENVYRSAVSGELTKIKHILGKEGFDRDKFALATSLLDSMVLKHSHLDEFLTIRAEEHLP
jgi:malate synthase